MYERMDWPGLRSLYKGEIVKEEEIRMVSMTRRPARPLVTSRPPSLQAFPGREDVFIRVNSAPVRVGGGGSGGAAAAASDIIAAVVVMEDITDLRDRESDRLRLLEEERGAKVRSAVVGSLACSAQRVPAAFRVLLVRRRRPQPSRSE